jgi:phosphoserine phosphatase
MKGRRKALEIRKALECKEFDYIGDHLADVPIFAEARLGYLVAPSNDLREAAGRAGTIAREFHTSSNPSEG